MGYVGFYINLDRSAERKSEMEAQFARYGLQGLYERFPAANGNALKFPISHLTDSEIGCFTSHYSLLKHNVGCRHPIHIVEDDVLFCRFTQKVILQTISSDAFRNYDMIFTDMVVPLLFKALREYKILFDRNVDRDRAGKIVDTRCNIVDYFASTSSYIVNPQSISKLIDIYAQELANGTKLPIDLVIQRKTREGVIRTGCLFPFVTSVRLDGITNQTILGRERDSLMGLALELLRHAFFVDCDLSEVYEHADETLPVPATDPHHRLLSRILAFFITENCQPN